MTLRSRAATALVAVAAVLVLAVPAGANTAQQAFEAPIDQAEFGRPCDQLGADAVGWNCPIESGAKVQVDSAAQVAFLADYVGLGATPQPAGRRWGAAWAIYRVDAATPYRTVCLTYAVNHKFDIWPEYIAVHDKLVADGVPIPSSDLPGGDLPYKDGGHDKPETPQREGDNGLTIYSSDANAIWEFYEFFAAPAGTVDPRSGKACAFVADVGQRMSVVGKHGIGRNPDGSGYAITPPANEISPGYWRENPPDEYRSVARAASKLPAIFAAVTGPEWNQPVSTDNGFGHMLAGALPWGRFGSFVWPAAATDRWSSWKWPAIQEGARLRLAPDADCARGDATLKWVRARNLCETFKRYGWIGTDQTGGGWSFMNFKWGDARVDDGVTGPNWYLDAFKDVYASKLQVLEPRAGAHDWTPGG